MFCPKCGDNLPDNVKFCDKCGHAFENSQEYSSTVASRKKEKKIKPIMIISIIVATLLLTVILILNRLYDVEHINDHLEITAYTLSGAKKHIKEYDENKNLVYQKNFYDDESLNTYYRYEYNNSQILITEKSYNADDNIIYQKNYRDDGSLLCEKTYDNGILNFKRDFNENEILTYEEEYEENLLKVARNFNENATLIYEEVYDCTNDSIKFKRTFNEKGSLTNEEEYIYENHDNVIKFNRDFYENGSLLCEEEFCYRDNTPPNLQFIIRKGFAESGTLSYEEKDYGEGDVTRDDYDTSGNLIRTTDYYENTPTHYAEYEYNENNILICRKQYDKNYTITVKDDYDINGNEICHTQYGTNGIFLEYTLSNYDNNNNLISKYRGHDSEYKESFFSWEGEYNKDNILIHEVSYAENGNKAREYFYYDDGQKKHWIEYSGSYKAKEYFYYKNGNLQEEIEYYSHLDPPLCTQKQLEKFYDENGKFTESIAYTTNGGISFKKTVREDNRENWRSYNDNGTLHEYQLIENVPLGAGNTTKVIASYLCHYRDDGSLYCIQYYGYDFGYSKLEKNVYYLEDGETIDWVDTF